jgi:3-phosphoshikimate 1-carboxyvinyltransferase
MGRRTRYLPALSSDSTALLSTFPEVYPVPAGLRPRGRFEPPPSKSLTHRYLTLALLARRPIRIVHPLFAEDTRLFMAALATSGWRVSEDGDELALDPPPLDFPAPDIEIQCGNCGTMLRLLVAALCAVPGRFVLDGIARLRERPIAPLVDALKRLGGHVDFLDRPGFVPIQITGETLVGGRTTLDARESSQYLSSLLLAALAAPQPSIIEVEALASAPYVDLTLEAARLFGGRIDCQVEAGRRVYRVEPSRLAADRVIVEADASSGCYGAAAAALCGGSVQVVGIPRDSVQGDVRFLEILQEMGATVELSADGWLVAGGRLRAVNADLSTMPDQVPTLAALAPFAEGCTRILNVRHLRWKESDRLHAMTTELRRLGAEVVEHEDGLDIPGVWATAAPPQNSVHANPHGDHRIAMSLAILGLRRPGVTISSPAVVAKSYPHFWEDLERLVGE